jgi:hypothetical protein
MSTRTALDRRAISFDLFWREFVRIPDSTGRLIPPSPHREQARFIQASDARDAAGLRRYREYFLHWGKKTAKSFSTAAKLAYHLVADPFEREDRRLAIASFDEDQSRIIFGQVKMLVDRHAWLRRHVKVLRTEMVFKETATDPSTGGRYHREHVLVALPRDLKGAHGENFSCIVRDELWSEPDQTFTESLILSPTRVCPEIVYLSYHGPRAMQRPGVPLFDLLERVRVGDPRLFYSHIGGEGTDAPWVVCPWVSDDWIAQQRVIFAASPQRFRRIILNLPAGADSGLITPEELGGSLITVDEPARGDPNTTYLAACDLAVVGDWTAFLIGHLDQESRLVIDVIRTWRGSREHPVSLVDVGEEVTRLHARFPWRRLDIDTWQARLMTEQLQRQGVPVRLVTIDASTVDTWVTKLKAAFTQRLVRIPRRASFLIEQLESVQAIEPATRGNRRRDLLKFQPGDRSGSHASAHDDLVVTLAMLVEMAGDELGQGGLPEQHECYREVSLRVPVPCYLWQDSPRSYVPSGCPSCAACPSHRAVLAAWRASGMTVDLRTFRRVYHTGDNSMVRRKRWAAVNLYLKCNLHV